MSLTPSEAWTGPGAFNRGRNLQHSNTDYCFYDLHLCPLEIKLRQLTFPGGHYDSPHMVVSFNQSYVLLDLNQLIRYT